MRMTVGILALQGDFAEHVQILKKLKVRTLEVRTPEDLSHVQKLIIPGGESTTMAKLLDSTGLRAAIIQRVKKGNLAVYGTCAGAILMARKVSGKNAPPTLGLLNIKIDRNAYGSQMQSFEASLNIKGFKKPLPAAFIRAPRITKTGWRVEVLASHEGSPVLVLKGNILAGTFHPEVRGGTDIHRLFLRMK